MPDFGHSYYRGYIWKYCPYSTNHRNKYYNNGFAGNTNNPEILALTTFGSVPTAAHPYTDGGMNMWNRGGAPGWICFDDACPFYLTNNVRYFEI